MDVELTSSSRCTYQNTVDYTDIQCHNDKHWFYTDHNRRLDHVFANECVEVWSKHTVLPIRRRSIAETRFFVGSVLQNRRICFGDDYERQYTDNTAKYHGDPGDPVPAQMTLGYQAPKDGSESRANVLNCS